MTQQSMVFGMVSICANEIALWHPTAVAGLQDCMVGLLFAFMPVLSNNRSGGEVDHLDVLRLLFRCVLLPCLVCLHMFAGQSISH